MRQGRNLKTPLPAPNSEAPLLFWEKNKNPDPSRTQEVTIRLNHKYSNSFILMASRPLAKVPFTRGREQGRGKREQQKIRCD